MAGAAGSRGRVHVILVPGFGGFDALGQLEYYAGLTPVFREWTARSRRSRLILHYFDNFPTAAVTTRAARLQRYLAKRIARREIVPGDTVCLVGHSTGGLDIRRLVWNLAHSPEAELVDGGVEVKDEEVLGFVRRVVFLSVPHWGTNIADWVRTHWFGRTVIVADLRAAVAGSQFPVLDRIQGWIASATASLSGADVLRAAQDALCEAEAFNALKDPTSGADAREAAAHLELWLRHMMADFSAIDDLASQPTAAGAASPAHFPPDVRREEGALWSGLRIATRSYATIGTRPFRFKPEAAAPAWDPIKLWTYAESSGDSSDTDLAYRFCYRACAGGPFSHKAPGGGIELWDNDGIVNTASMFWPGGDTVLVEGDHMDIVGHYKLTPMPGGNGRKWQSYDLLGSASGFGDDAFERVWNGILDFCACPD